MALLIEKQEALALLRANIKHYLWYRPLSRWTKEDVENLRNGINKNYNNVLGPKTCYKGQAIAVTKSDETLKFESVMKAAEFTGVPAANIYALVNGKNARAYGFTFNKIS